MGYTHYWDRPSTIPSTIFQAIAHDLSRLLPALEAAGSPLGNAYGREEPEITTDFIGFNGLVCCGHFPNPNLRLPWPTDSARGVGDNKGLEGSLPYRTCNGDCSYESLWFARCEPATEAEQHGGFCKTAFRPYDLAVTAFLVIAKYHLREKIAVSSDGKDAHWREAFALCQAELGYGATFLIHNGVLHSSEASPCT